MKEFNFKIEGNDVDDLLKVVGNKGTEEVKETKGCFVCGSTQTYTTANSSALQCSNCNTLIGKL